MALKIKVLGERLDTIHNNENTSEHLHRYALASAYCINKTVLDIACGEGYGSNLLSQVGLSVKGVDIDKHTIDNASRKYVSQNLEFKEGRADEIPYGNGLFDIVISFETLEHHDKHDEMMSEIRRVLVPGGMCIISTPDKKVYTDDKKYQNPFHVKELYKDDFKALLQKSFKNVILFRQQFYAGSLLTPDVEPITSMDFLTGSFAKTETLDNLPSEYLIAFASDSTISQPKASFFIDKDFTENKIQQFQNSSLRYKVGKLVLSPFRIFKKGNK